MRLSQIRVEELREDHEAFVRKMASFPKNLTEKRSQRRWAKDQSPFDERPMTKVVQLEYSMRTKAIHNVEVPDWFDVSNKEHVDALIDNEELSMCDYHDEANWNDNVTAVEVHADHVSGSYDFTDLEKP